MLLVSMIPAGEWLVLNTLELTNFAQKAYHFSGLRVEYDSTEKDKLQLRALEVHGRPLTQDNLYTIAVTNYCHDNDLMKNIPWFSESAKRLNSLNNIRDAIVQHVRMVRTIS